MAVEQFAGERTNRQEDKEVLLVARLARNSRAPPGRDPELKSRALVDGLLRGGGDLSVRLTVCVVCSIVQYYYLFRIRTQSASLVVPIQKR